MRLTLLVLLAAGCGSAPAITFADGGGDLARPPLAQHARDMAAADAQALEPPDLAPGSDLGTPPDLTTPRDLDAPGDMTACHPVGSSCTMNAQCCLSWASLPMDAMNVQAYCDVSLGCVGLYQIRDNCVGSAIRQCRIDSQHGTVCTGCM